MNVIKTEIPDVLIFEPKVFGDERGFFMESFNQKVFEEAVGGRLNLFRIIILNRVKVYLEVYTFSFLPLSRQN